jgi:hypothetical protein
MCWKCENPDGADEVYLDELREMMGDDPGWQVQFVEHDRRPLAYTVGLHNRGLPELLITGLNAHVSNRVLKSIGHMIVDDGTYLAPAMHIDYQDRFLMEVVEVDHPDVHLKYAVRICGREVRALQLVWADDRGRWPWEAGWGNGRHRQPVFGVRTPLLG